MKKLFVVIIFTVFFLTSCFNYNEVDKINKSINVIKENKIENKNIINNRKDLFSVEFELSVKKYKNNKKSFDDKINIAFSNIDYFLKNNTIKDIDNSSIKYETYNTVWNLLLFKFIKNKDECSEISKSYFILDKEYFLKDCNFNYFLKNQLSNNSNNIPDEIKKYNNIFWMIESWKCTLENFNCYFLWNTKWYIDFKNDIIKYTKENKVNFNKDIKNFSLSNYWFYIFWWDYKKVNENNIIDHMYDQALLNKYIRIKNKKICNKMKYEQNKIFCNDFFDKSKDEYYKNLYKQFFIKLYLQEKNDN